MHADAAQHILDCLQQVAEQRRLRRLAPGLEPSVHRLKQYQQERFARTYADLLASPRYRDAARFFLDELYGPHDFSLRDAQFARVVPALTRLFPREVVATVRDLAELHAISEQLDSEMGRQLLAAPRLTAALYRQAWQACGQAALRERQITLTVSIGQALDSYTRKPLLRQALRMMRGPATAAGLSELQHFLEQGFDTFKALHGAKDFLDTVNRREQGLAQALFGATCPPGDDPLGQLP